MTGQLIGSLILWLIVAVIVRYVVFRALTGLDFDRRAEELGVSVADWTPSRSASKLVASVTYWVILLIGLMLGFAAEAEPDPPQVDGELGDARWFGADEVRAALARGEPGGPDDDGGPLLSPSISISRWLIVQWLAAVEAGRKP